MFTYKKSLFMVVGISLILAWASVASAKKTTITFWGWISPEWVSTYRDFERQHPNIKIKESLLSRQWAATSEKFLTAIAAGKAPDACLQNAHQFLQFASRGIFQDLSELAKRDGIKRKDWLPYQLKACYFAGKLFALPLTTDVRAFYYNKRLFREAGLDPESPPETWEELEQIGPKLNKQDEKGRFTQLGFAPCAAAFNPGAGDGIVWIWIWENGGKFLDSTGKKYIIDNPKNVEAVQWIVDYADKYCGGGEKIAAFLSSAKGLAQDPFLTERLAMKVGGSWELWPMATIPTLDYGVGLMPKPKDGQRHTYSCGGVLALPVGSKHVEEAWTFIKWLSGVDVRGPLSYAKNCLRERAKSWKRQQLPGKVVYVPDFYSNRKALKALEEKYAPLLPEKVRREYRLMIDSLNYTYFCGGLTDTAWGLTGLNTYNEVQQAVQDAQFHKMTVKESLSYHNKRLQKALDEAWSLVRVK